MKIRVQGLDFSVEGAPERVGRVDPAVVLVSVAGATQKFVAEKIADSQKEGETADFFCAGVGKNSQKDGKTAFFFCAGVGGGGFGRSRAQGSART